MNSRMAQAAVPIMPPPIRPPNRSNANSSPACMSDSAPETANPMAIWKITVPVTSLNRASPISSVSWRLPKRKSFDSAVTAGASVDPMAPPSAKATASGMAGSSACSVNPTASTMATTSPTASEAMAQRLAHSAPESAWRDSLKCRGAMNRISSSSGSMPLCRGVVTSSAMSAPRAICTKGSDKPGSSLSRTDEATTAANRNSTSSKAPMASLLCFDDHRIPAPGNDSCILSRCRGCRP